LTKQSSKILLFANTDWYLYNFRRSLAEKLRAEGWDVVLVSPPGEYGPKLTALGFRWVSFPFSTRSTNPLQELMVLLRLILLYRRERPDLCHHFTIKCVLYGSLAARFSGCRRIINAITGRGHIFSDSGLTARLLRPVVRVLYRLVHAGRNDRVIFQNSEDRDYFVDNGLVAAEATVLIRGSGVDCERFKSTIAAADPEKKVQVLFASRMLREKGIYELIAAARQLQERQLPVDMLLAGDIYPGNPSSLTKSELEQVSAGGEVTYLGQVEDMPELLAQSDIVVLPSYSEGTPRILIEAAAMEKPIVATDIAGCRGLVENEVNGLLVSVKDSLSLANALERLISDRDLRLRFGRAGREIVLSEFDERIVLARTLAVYAD